jgi:hypothetical protein
MTTQPQASPKKATITLDSANNDHQYPAYQLSINALDGEHSGHGYRILGPKYAGRSRNLRTAELSRRDADEIRAILDEVFPPENAAPVLPSPADTAAGDESPHVYLTAIRHQAGLAHDFTKAGRMAEALEHVEAVERLLAVYRRAVGA